MATSTAAGMVAETVPAFTVFAAQVRHTRSVSPNLVRVTVGGAELAGMTSGGLDQRIKVLLPRAGQQRPYLPTGERTFRALRQLPQEQRPIHRTYTIRAHRPEACEIDIDFVLHGDTGPGSAFAERARVGDQLAILGPNAAHDHGEHVGGVEYRLDAVDEHTLLVGDETALPAIGSIVEALPAGVRATVLVEVPQRADARTLHSAADLDVGWVPRDTSTGSGAASLLPTLRSMSLPAEQLYAWVCGESGMVKAVRRHLVAERGLPRSAVTFMGYWRDGHTEDAPPESG